MRSLFGVLRNVPCHAPALEQLGFVQQAGEDWIRRVANGYAERSRRVDGISLSAGGQDFAVAKNA
ncbi:MAG: hypothetical protein P8Y07_10455 [Gemmatimonadales bacterium]